MVACRGRRALMAAFLVALIGAGVTPAAASQKPKEGKTWLERVDEMTNGSELFEKAKKSLFGGDSQRAAATSSSKKKEEATALEELRASLHSMPPDVRALLGEMTVSRLKNGDVDDLPHGALLKKLRDRLPNELLEKLPDKDIDVYDYAYALTVPKANE